MVKSCDFTTRPPRDGKQEQRFPDCVVIADESTRAATELIFTFSGVPGGALEPL